MTEEHSQYKNARQRSRQNTHLTQHLGKIPPQALELEEAVLGAMMLEKEAVNIVEEILTPDSFYKTAHQEIFRAILELSKVSSPIDILTVTQQLRKAGNLELAGGSSAVARLTGNVNSAANIEYHARTIAELAIKRNLISLAGEVQREAYEDNTDVFELLDYTEREVFAISEGSIGKKTNNLKEILAESLKQLEEKKDKQDKFTGVPSGFHDLDRITNGWQKSDLVIIAARPGMGKTSFVLSVLRNAAVDYQLPVAIFSLEMSGLQLVNRLISAESELRSEQIRSGMLNKIEWQQLYSRVENLQHAQIFIDDTAGISITEMRAKVRRLKAKYDIQLVVVDYLQLMSGGSGALHNKTMNVGNREQEIAMISRSLKNLAKEINIPVIALAQLSRAVETRGGEKRPQLSDLRESGSLEQDADMVLFLYRPEYYGLTQDAEGNPTNNIAELMISKNRNGATKDIKLKFIGDYTKFENLDDVDFTRRGGNGGDFTLGSKVNQPLPPQTTEGSESANTFEEGNPNNPPF